MSASDTIPSSTLYPFVLQDKPSVLWTMRQVNQNYLSGLGLFTRGLYSVVKNSSVADIVELTLGSLFFLPFTHEEGHRSVLTARAIGSVSQPYFNKKGYAYVKGISDETLRDLRDTDLPEYIRLHTAGLESDYMLTKRVETICAFDTDDFRHYRFEYLIRKISLLQYYGAGLVKLEVDEKEEEDEYERDIVGFDTYGAARHLYRPNMPFYRYTAYSDLTSEEKRLIKRVGYRSFINLLHPLIIGRERFLINDSITWNAGAGYLMVPFGDCIEETFWLSWHDRIHVMAYLRQFQNHDAWFPAFGIGIYRYFLHERFSINACGHIWKQPKAHAFMTDKSKNGGAFDCELSWFMLYKGVDNGKRGISIDVGLLYKTDGFLPEVMYLNEQFIMRFGTTLKL